MYLLRMHHIWGMWHWIKLTNKHYVKRLYSPLVCVSYFLHVSYLLFLYRCIIRTIEGKRLRGSALIYCNSRQLIRLPKDMASPLKYSTSALSYLLLVSSYSRIRRDDTSLQYCMLRGKRPTTYLSTSHLPTRHVEYGESPRSTPFRYFLQRNITHYLLAH